MTKGKKKAGGRADVGKHMSKLPPGLRVGHAHDANGLTGCTVFLFDVPAQAQATIRGSAPATSEFSSLDPMHASGRVDAICFAGGSSFGHAAGVGVQRFLEDQGRGFDVGVTFVPNVPLAAIFDLSVGDYTARPTAQMAVEACLSASDKRPAEGSFGVGMGATVGKFFGMDMCMRGGFGLSSIVSPLGAEIWAFAAVNSFGDIWQPGREKIIAGARLAKDSLEFANTAQKMASGWRRLGMGSAVEIIEPADWQASPGERKLRQAPEYVETADKWQKTAGKNNTTLVLVVTTARLSLVALKKLSEACHLGVADVVFPAYTVYDGDLSLACSIGDVEEDFSTLCVLTQKVVADAIISGVNKAASHEGLPCAQDIKAESGKVPERS